MSSPFNHFENNSTAQTRSESRDGRSDHLPGLTSRLPFCPTFTLRPPQAAANLTGRIIPGSEPATSQESHGKLSPNHLEFTADVSGKTLYDRTEELQRSLNRVSLSSYQHPNDIPPPRHFAAPPLSGTRRRYGHRVSSEGRYSVHGEDSTSPSDFKGEPPRHRGVMSNISLVSRTRLCHGTTTEFPPPARDLPESRSQEGIGDLITGATRESLDDPADLERNVKEQMDLRSMSYKQRRKGAQKIKIHFFVTSLNRQQFIMKLARALTFGAPSHRIESQLVAAARILEVEVDAKKAADNLDALLNSEPIYGI
ncbi:hypothetical protein EDB83DRAFT_2513083 [Lactarius deliciosus]|nr:hypothetical protein EDB83DRAFT_2513083 [Lactarius deliciosus]